MGLNPYLTAAFASIISVSWAAAPSDFFANQDIQSQAPAAFALQPEASRFVESLESVTRIEKEALVNTLLADKAFLRALSRWERLDIQEQIPYLKRVFAIQCRVLGIKPPRLVFDSDAKTGAAYFDFDPNQPGPGAVILNPKALAGLKNKYASLLLLIHETRHSAQFQLAFATYRSGSPLSEGFKKAFLAQKRIKPASFCDFMTLLNEYEAFQFANFVVGKLTDWSVDTTDMGSFASQYDKTGALKIDLADLIDRFGSLSLLKAFNHLEKDQYRILRKKP